MPTDIPKLLKDFQDSPAMRKLSLEDQRTIVDSINAGDQITIAEISELVHGEIEATRYLDKLTAQTTGQVTEQVVGAFERNQMAVDHLAKETTERSLADRLLARFLKKKN